jgi:hypothetical protein
VILGYRDTSAERFTAGSGGSVWISASSQDSREAGVGRSGIVLKGRRRAHYGATSRSTDSVYKKRFSLHAISADGFTARFKPFPCSSSGMPCVEHVSSSESMGMFGEMIAMMVRRQEDFAG